VSCPPSASRPSTPRAPSRTKSAMPLQRQAPQLDDEAREAALDAQAQLAIAAQLNRWSNRNRGFKPQLSKAFGLAAKAAQMPDHIREMLEEDAEVTRRMWAERRARVRVEQARPAEVIVKVASDEQAANLSAPSEVLRAAKSTAEAARALLARAASTSAAVAGSGIMRGSCAASGIMPHAAAASKLPASAGRAPPRVLPLCCGILAMFATAVLLGDVGGGVRRALMSWLHDSPMIYICAMQLLCFACIAVAVVAARRVCVRCEQQEPCALVSAASLEADHLPMSLKEPRCDVPATAMGVARDTAPSES